MKKRTQSLALALSITLTTAACSSASRSIASESGEHRDVQVLQAWYGNGINSGFGFGADTRPILSLPWDECRITSPVTPINSGSDIQGATRDCLNALQAVTQSPVTGRFDVQTYWKKSALKDVRVYSFGCSTVEIRTVSPKTMIEGSQFEGIGFYFNGTTTFVPKSKLHVVGETRLKDGQPAWVHRFVGADLCKTSGASSYPAQITGFNAYAQIGGIKRWELESRNHQIGYANGNKTSNGSGSGNTVPLLPMSFDRQDELLQK